MLGNTDAGGESVSQALERAGFDPSPDSLRAAAVPRDKVRAGGVGGWAWVSCWWLLLRRAGLGVRVSCLACMGQPACRLQE